MLACGGLARGRDRDRRLAPGRAQRAPGRADRARRRARARRPGAASRPSTCSRGLHACSQHLLRYGGHRAAAGLEIERAPRGRVLDARCARTRARCSRAATCAAVERVDAVVGGRGDGHGAGRGAAALAPFGRGNPRADAAARRREPSPTCGRWAKAGTCASPSAPRGVSARAVAFGCGGRLPVADGEPRAGDLHARGQRVERGQRAAPGAAPGTPRGADPRRCAPRAAAGNGRASRSSPCSPSSATARARLRIRVSLSLPFEA